MPLPCLQDSTVCEYNVTQGETPRCVANPPNCGELLWLRISTPTFRTAAARSLDSR